MEAGAYIKNLKISPKKLRFLLPAIKKMSPVESLDYLFYTPKKGAKIFYKAIKSAITNAKAVLKTSEDLLKFKVLTVEEGRKLKRSQPGGKGTVKPIKKRYAHIKVILTVGTAESVTEKKLAVINKEKKESSKFLPKGQSSFERKSQISKGRLTSSKPKVKSRESGKDKKL